MRARLASFLLRRAQLLGINARNLGLVYEHNPAALKRLVDDKISAKERFDAAGVPSPRTLAVFESISEVRELETLLPEREGFVVKPARASGGAGILVVRRTSSGALSTPARQGARGLTTSEVGDHVRQILSGLWNAGRLFERAFIEELVEEDDVLGGIADGGLPDVRVLTLRGEPVQAMARVPTRRSRGKANLHQGALGLGVDLASGRTCRAILGSRSIERHPDSRRELIGIELPHWPEILALSRRSAACFPLGYLGVDVVIDRERGPLVLEVNARPGLAIQLANGRGLSGLLSEETPR